MAKVNKKPARDRRALHLSQRHYTLRQVRPFVRVGLPLVTLLIGFAGGALALRVWQTHRWPGPWQMASAAALPVTGAVVGAGATMPASACIAAPAPADGVEAELERTKLQLAQEKVSRAAVQQSADASAAEASRLANEVKFLRGEAKPAR